MLVINSLDILNKVKAEFGFGEVMLSHFDFNPGMELTIVIKGQHYMRCALHKETQVTLDHKVNTMIESLKRSIANG